MGRTILIVSLSLTISNVLAGEIDLGASTGRAGRKESCTVFTHVGTNGQTCDSNGRSWTGFAGYHLDKTWGVEVGYNKFNTLSDGQGMGAEYRRNAWDALGTVRLPIGEKLYPYLKAGAYHAEAKLEAPMSSMTDKNNGLAFGGGLELDFVAHFGVRAEWMRFRNVGGANTTKSDIYLGTVGLLVKF
jgi:hypothetical protein